MLKLRLNPLAVQDIEQIRAYIADEFCNPEAADRTVKSIFSACQSLKGMPKMGKKLSSVINVETGFRYLVSGNYLIFYRIDREYISVYRVLNGRMDYTRILFGRDMPDSADE